MKFTENTLGIVVEVIVTILLQYLWYICISRSRLSVTICDRLFPHAFWRENNHDMDLNPTPSWGEPAGDGAFTGRELAR